MKNAISLVESVENLHGKGVSPSSHLLCGRLEFLALTTSASGS